MLGRRGGKVLNWKRWREACLARVKGESEVKNGVKRWLPLIFYLLATTYVASGQNFLTVNLQYTCISKNLIFLEFDLPNVAIRKNTLPVKPHC